MPALIVVINSPGGSVAGGESLHDAIARVAAKKPVVAVMGGTAASAGYMVAMPAARIFARDATLTGSIGVLLETGEVSGLLGKLGVTAEAITSGPLKDQPSFTRPLSPAGAGRAARAGDGHVRPVRRHGRRRPAHVEPTGCASWRTGAPIPGGRRWRSGWSTRSAASRRRGVARGRAPASRPSCRSRMSAPAALAERAFGASARPLLGIIGKTLLLQGLRLDGAWALWQPSGR